MRVPLEELLEAVGVIDRTLYAYETHPWFLYDEEKKITCSAEVRMGPDETDLEAEIQFVYDEDYEFPKMQEGERPKKEKDFKEIIDDGDDDDEDHGGSSSGGFPGPEITGHEQIMIMRAHHFNDGKWEPTALVVKNKPYHGPDGDLAEWPKKGCNFFRACVEALQMGEIPDIDALIEKELSDYGGYGGGRRRGRVGKKSPKIKPAQLLGMGKGAGGM